MGTEELGMVGGGQTPKVDIGLNSTPGVHVAAQIETFGRAQGQGTPKRPVSTRSTEREFVDPNKAFSTESVRFIPSDRDFSAQQGGYQMEESHHREEGGQGGGDDRPAAYGPQLGSMGGNGREQEWAQEQRVSVETEYREDAGVRDEMSGSEASHSEGTDEEEEEEDDEGDMEDNEVDGEGPGERGSEGVSEHVEGETGGLPLSHSQMGGLDPDQVRQDAAIASRDGGFQRNVLDRERSALKAGVGNTGVSNSPFGIFHSPSSTLPFLNSFSSSPSSAQLGGGHTDTNQAQNGSGMGVGPGSNAASYSLTREGGLSREASREGFRESTVTGSLQEHARITSGPLHEQLQSSADADNYYTNYTTLLNSQINNNNGLKATDSTNDSSGRRRITDSQSSAEPSLRRILSDPLTGTLMEDAMIISCGHSVGSAGLRRVLATSVCITCGASVRTEVMAPNYALRLAVQAYKREEEMTGNIGIKPAKRRRDPAQESIGHIEQQPVLDTTRAKGVQFPFVVSDRVMIKGNKRTPERFVGREAVITTQCLNGWYLVRTLDSGESVRLQYRSLQKVGGWGGNEPTMAEFAGVNFGTQCVE